MHKIFIHRQIPIFAIDQEPSFTDRHQTSLFQLCKDNRQTCKLHTCRQVLIIGNDFFRLIKALAISIQVLW